MEEEVEVGERKGFYGFYGSMGVWMTREGKVDELYVRM